MTRFCKAQNERSEPCGTPPLVDSDLCFWHDPRYEKEAADARRVGGANHRKEQMLQGIYGVEGLESVSQIRRLYDLAVTAALSVEKASDRARLLLAAGKAALDLLQAGELEDRVSELENVLDERPQPVQKDKRRRWGFR